MTVPTMAGISTSSSSHLFPIRVLRYSVAVAAIAQIFYAWYVSRLMNVVVLESTGMQEDMGAGSELDPEDRRSSGRASTFVPLRVQNSLLIYGLVAFNYAVRDRYRCFCDCE